MIDPDFKVAGIALDSTAEKLSDATYGFNAVLSAMATARSQSGFAIDFANPGRTFYRAQLDPRRYVARASTRAFPVMSLYLSNGADELTGNKNWSFRGNVQVNVLVLLTQGGENIPADLEDRAALVVDALIQTVTSIDVGWGPCVNYNGAIAFGQGQVGEGQGEAWVYTAGVSFPLKVTAN